MLSWLVMVGIALARPMGLDAMDPSASPCARVRVEPELRVDPVDHEVVVVAALLDDMERGFPLGGDEMWPEGGLPRLTD